MGGRKERKKEKCTTGGKGNREAILSNLRERERKRRDD